MRTNTGDVMFFISNGKDLLAVKHGATVKGPCAVCALTEENLVGAKMMERGQ